MLDEPTEITVTVEVPPTETTESTAALSSDAPPNSDTTAALVAVATEVGATSAAVEDHTTRLTELEAENQSLRSQIQLATDMALSAAATAAAATAEPETMALEAETVTVPPVVDADDLKAPRQERGPIARILFGA